MSDGKLGLLIFENMSLIGSRYSTEPFAGANGQIPQLNLWDDHDVSHFLNKLSGFRRSNLFRSSMALGPTPTNS
jgi:hypothetical protein